MSETLKQKTKLEIRQGIEKESSLHDIKREIENSVVGGKLSYVDSSYIERKYIHTVMKYWLQEVSEFLNTNTNKNFIIDLIKDSNLNLEKLKEALPTIKYFNLFHGLVINKAWEQKIMYRFRDLCLSEILKYEYEIEEIRFVENIIGVISNSEENFKDFIGILTDFKNSKIDFRRLLENILKSNSSSNEMIEIKKYAEKLVERTEYCYETKVRECLEKLALEVSIKQKNGMNRTYLEVIGGVIFMSEVLLKIETEFSKSHDLTEVQIVAPYAVHIDISLTQNKWHGKNLVVYTKKIFVKECVEINVSGVNGLEIDTKGVDGDSSGANGKDGSDGNCGESGGNVLIMADEIYNSKNLKIISNGGAGSNGQNGGNGKDGVNGSAIDKEELLKTYPSFAKFVDESAERNREIALRNIEQKCNKYCNIDWKNKEWRTGNLYVDGESTSGEKIILSSCSRLKVKKYTYFILKGSPGESGGVGGQFGFGGEAGHEGCIDIFTNLQKNNICEIVRESNSGKNGNEGTLGISGKPGLDGWDIGYADRSHWKQAFYYGENKETKLKVRVDVESNDSVHCFKYNCQCAIITCGSIYDTLHKYEQTRNLSQTRKRQQNSITQRKKNISKESIKDNYVSRMDLALLSELNTVTRQYGDIDITSLLNEIDMGQTENAILEGNEMRVATYAGANKKHTTTRSRKPVSSIKIPISYTFSEAIKYLDLNSVNYILTTDIFSITDTTKKIKVLENMMFRLRQFNNTKLLTETQFLYICALKRNMLLGFNTIELSKYLSTNELHENHDMYKMKYLEEVDTKYSGNELIMIRNFMKYFTDINSEKEQNAIELIEYITNFFVIQNYDQGVAKKKQHINEFITSFILENLDRNISEFGLCLEYLEKHIYIISNNESLDKQIVKLEQTVVNKVSLPNKEPYKWWISENVTEKKQKINEILSMKKYFDWSQYEYQDILFPAMLKIFSEDGCKHRLYRDLVSFKESTSFYYIDVNNDKENWHLHTFDSLKEVDLIYVCCTGMLYEARVLNKKYFNLELKRYEASSVSDHLLFDIHSLNSKDAIINYKISDCIDITKTETRKNKINNSDIKFIQFLENVFKSKNFNELLPMLNKISKKNLNPTNFLLLSLYNVFQIETIRVPIEVLKLIINEVMEAYICNLSTYNSLAWIVSTTEQNEWIHEVIYLIMENCCKESLIDIKTDILNNLRKITDINISIYFYEYLKNTTLKKETIWDVISTIKMLGPSNYCDISILEEVNLDDWKYILAGKYYEANLKRIFPSYNDEDLVTDAYLVSLLCNLIGDPKEVKLFNALLSVERIEKSTDISNFLRMLIDKYYDFETCVQNICKEKSLKNLKLIFNYENIRDIDNICNIIANNSNTSVPVIHNLKSTIEIIKNINSLNSSNNIPSQSLQNKIDILTPQLISEFTKRRLDLHNFTLDEITSHVKKYRPIYKNLELNEIIFEVLSLIDTAVQLTRGFKLRDTQKLAIILILQNQNNILAEVSTGEGKSLIVTAIAIIKALKGSTVDICTSSALLAKRDAESEPPKGCKDLYNIFDISVAHNCSDDIDKRKKAYSENVVIYGHISNFQRDYLMDNFYNKNILGGRKYETVIIDEVDSMLLDKGNNILYLSHDLPGLDRLERLYVFLWLSVACNTENLSITDLKNNVLNMVFKKIFKQDLQVINHNLTNSDINNIWNELCSANVIDKTGILKVKSITDLHNITFPGYETYKDRLIYFINNRIEMNTDITVPNYLTEFVITHLDSWIENAMIAKLMVEGTDYVVDVDRTKTHPDRYPMITILDRDTGTDLGNSQWDEVLHQFLQIKHGCKLSLQKLKAVFVSNVSYFKTYENLYGLTGTLGSKVERELLTYVYSVDFVTIPTAKLRKFEEDHSIVCADFNSWVNNLVTTTKSRIAGGQSVLLIFETINELKEVESVFRNQNIVKDIKVYQRDYEEFDLTQGNNTLDAGVVILATNLAGRGADIKLHKNIVDAGGLHVCLTYLPRNCRIEQQAFGRASRCGEPGSGQLIFITDAMCNINKLSIKKLKTERDRVECLRINSIKNYYENQILIEEDYLKKFTIVLKQKKDMLDSTNIPKELKSILLKACLNNWAFWLDRNSKEISDKEKINGVVESFKSLLIRTVSLAYDEKRTNWSLWTDDPFIKIQIAKTLIAMKHFDEALGILTAIIQNEPNCNELAHYYISAIYISKINWEEKKNNPFFIFEDEYNANLYKEIKTHLTQARRKLENISHENLQICAISDKIKQNIFDKLPSIVEVDALRKQKENTSILYNHLIESIDDILGHKISGQNFVSENIDSLTGEKIFNTLQPHFSPTTINYDYNKEDLNTIAAKYLVDETKLENILKINKTPFQLSAIETEFKKSLQLPSRDEFWENLEKQEIFKKLEDFVFVDYKLLESFDPSLLETLKTYVANKSITCLQYDEDKEPIVFKFGFSMSKDCGLFDSTKFIQMVGDKRYQFLKNNSVILYNIKAEIDISKVDHKVSFSNFDVVNEEDFESETISKTELAYIIKSLCEVNILGKVEKEGFNLNINNMNLLPKDLFLYQEHILRVLENKFVYRFQLNSLVEQVRNNFFPIVITLKTNPYNELIMDLINENIINNPYVVEDTDKLKSDVERIWSPFISYDKLQEELLNFGLIENESKFKVLIEELKLKKWLRIPNLEGLKLFIKNITAKDSNEQFEILEKGSELVDDFKSINLTLSLILNNKLKLSSNIIHLVKILEDTKSNLISIDNPKAKFLSISEMKLEGDFTLEINNFILNGCDHIITLHGKKFTMRKLKNAGILTALGALQLAAGVALIPISGGTLTVLGIKLIREGISDNLKAISCFSSSSGQYNWAEYSINKSLKIALATVTLGLSAIVTNKIQILNTLASKVNNESVRQHVQQFLLLQKNKENKSETIQTEKTSDLLRREVNGHMLGESSMTIIKTDESVLKGGKVIGRVLEVEESILSVSAEFNYFGESFTTNLLNASYERFRSMILESIGEEIKKHEVNAVINELITTCGSVVVKSQITIIINEHFTEDSKKSNENTLRIVNICSCALTEIRKVSEINIQPSSSAEFESIFSNIMSKITEDTMKSDNLRMLQQTINSTLNNISKDLKEKVQEEIAPIENIEQSIDELEDIKRELLELIRNEIISMGGRILKDNLLKPLLNWGKNFVNELKPFKFIEENAQFHKNNSGSPTEGFAGLDSKLQSSPEIYDSVTSNYNLNNLVLLNKCRSPELFADIIKENIPMDATCVIACLNIICKMQDIQKLSVEINNSSDESQLFTVGSNSGIYNFSLTVDTNDIQKCDDVLGNDCLFVALVNQIPDLNSLTPEELRNKVAETIVNDTEIRQKIKIGWHTLGTKNVLLEGADPNDSSNT